MFPLTFLFAISNLSLCMRLPGVVSSVQAPLSTKCAPSHPWPQCQSSTQQPGAPSGTWLCPQAPRHHAPGPPSPWNDAPDDARAPYGSTLPWPPTPRRPSPGAPPAHAPVCSPRVSTTQMMGGAPCPPVRRPGNRP